MGVYPILTMGIVIFPIQYNTIMFFRENTRSLKKVKHRVVKDRNNCSEEEEDKVMWMRRMRRDQFFRKCRKKSGEEEEDEVLKMRRIRMRKDRFSLRYNPSDQTFRSNPQIQSWAST